MVHIEFDQNVLIIDVTDRPELFVGQFSLMFREQGFVKSEFSQKYIMDDPIKIRSTVDDLIAFFRRKRIPVHMSDNFDRLNEQIGEERKVFEAASELGLVVKEEASEANALDLPGFKRMLKPYQEKAVRHMLAVWHTANFSVPGSGKTTMLYAGFSVWREMGKSIKSS